MGLLGVVACFANKISEEFKSLILHQIFGEVTELVYVSVSETEFYGFESHFRHQI